MIDSHGLAPELWWLNFDLHQDMCKGRASWQKLMIDVLLVPFWQEKNVAVCNMQWSRRGVPLRHLQFATYSGQAHEL
ncbi:hypothetical protein [Aeromonas veronii]|uniref:hypothetical protein n=1 Tax=Aeromonas veronii TaxID=654 RepID=UPI0011169315|nr:hypothetical protein [Aeromonas veronii]